MTQTAFDFSGSNYDPALDRDRLAGQMLNIFNLMSDGIPRTLREISDITGYGEASISAQLRNLRKIKIDFDKRRRGEPANGLFEYWLVNTLDKGVRK